MKDPFLSIEHIKSSSFTTCLTPEDEVNNLCFITEDVTKINVERCINPEYVVNSRGESLHVHSYWPEEQSLDAVIISLHGMGSHSNRPSQKYVSEKFTENGLAYVCIDFSGHGHSEGVKGLVGGIENLLDDVLSLLRYLYSSLLPCDKNCNKFRLKRHVEDVPFFLMGQSMGGATALEFGYVLSNGLKGIPPISTKQRSMASLFRGCLLVAPAIEIALPPPIIVTLLDLLVVPFFGTCEIPEVILSRDSKQNNAKLWINKSFIDYVTRDTYPANPEGLTYGGPVKFQTGSTLIKLARKLKAIIHKVNFPFLVFHDPKEKVVLVEGSVRLYEESTTSEENKKIVLIEGGLHDLLSNRFTLICNISIKWIKSQLLLTSKETKDDGLVIRRLVSYGETKIFSVLGERLWGLWILLLCCSIYLLFSYYSSLLMLFYPL